MKTCACLFAAIAAISGGAVLGAGPVMAGSLNPTNAPAPTMYTLEQIYQKQVDVDQKVDAIVMCGPSAADHDVKGAG